MSDTPRTDAAREVPAGFYFPEEKVPADFARQLERENAALLLKIQDLELQNNAMRSTSRGKEVAKNKKLERENAALRADKERLDWIETNARLTRKVGYLRWSFEGPECGTVRGSIDIARGKEAQP